MKSCLPLQVFLVQIVTFLNYHKISCISQINRISRISGWNWNSKKPDSNSMAIIESRKSTNFFGIFTRRQTQPFSAFNTNIQRTKLPVKGNRYAKQWRVIEKWLVANERAQRGRQKVKLRSEKEINIWAFILDESGSLGEEIPEDGDSYRDGEYRPTC